MDTLISVIMSVYNENEVVLKESIDSILNQSYENIEFIIVLDNPNNINIKEILLAYKKKDDRVNVLVNERNIGLAASLNKALDICKGTYVARMDADDISFVDRIRIQKEYLDRNIEIVMCSTQAKKIGDSTKYLKSKFFSFDEINACLLINNCIIHPSVMFRKSFLDMYHLMYDENFLCSQDYELWSRITRIGKMAVLDKVLLYYRVHKEQISNAKRERQVQMAKNILHNQLENAGVDCSQENLKMHMILARYELCDKDSLSKLSNWVEYLISNFKNKSNYNYDSLAVILRSKLISCVLKSNVEVTDKLVFCIKHRIVSDFGTLYYFVKSTLLKIKRRII